MSSWTKATTLEALAESGTAVFRKDGRQIALLRTDGGVRAFNNRCPHEGYPLSEGSLDGGCVLTCNWHAWKFDLKTGDNLYGGDRLRVYPVEIRGEEVWVDLTDPPFEARLAEFTANLRDAFDDNDYQRMARELGRLGLLGADSLDALRLAIEWSHDRMEFGWTHAYAAIADWLALHDEVDDPALRLACLLEGVAHVADDVLREPVYSFPESRATYDEDAFVQAVEREDADAATAMVRGAMAAGLGFEGVERGLTRAALAHYNDFGHSLIYVTKAARLVERLGPRVAEPLVLALTRSLVYARREDLIPEFRGYTAALGNWDANRVKPVPHMDAFRKLGIEMALRLTARAAGAPPEKLYRSLLGANAANMLAFDVGQQDRVAIPISDNVGWLDFTHGITFANAVRIQCGRFPDLWPRGLLQMACFSGRNAGFTVSEPDLDTWRVSDPDRFLATAVENLFDHGRAEFIVSVHLLKTVLAIREEVAVHPSGGASEHLLAALNRFLNSPLKRKHVLRTAHQALAFVSRDQ